MVTLFDHLPSKTIVSIEIHTLSPSLLFFFKLQTNLIPIHGESYCISVSISTFCSNAITSFKNDIPTSLSGTPILSLPQHLFKSPLFVQIPVSALTMIYQPCSLATLSYPSCLCFCSNPKPNKFLFMEGIHSAKVETIQSMSLLLSTDNN